MNYKYACENLDIHTKNFTIRELKQKYRLKALLYHPDKNKSIDAVSKFQEINSSYEYLLKFNEFENNDDDDYYPSYDENDGGNSWNSNSSSNINNKYLHVLFSFLKHVVREQQGTSPTALMYALFKQIATTCEKTVLDTLEKLDKNMLLKIYEIIKLHSAVLHIEKEFTDKIEEIILSKTKNDECIIVNPLIDDLFDNNLYKMKYNGDTIIVPLWHNELVYDISGCDIYVKCNPVLPKNVSIDNENNLHVDVEYEIHELWDKKTVDIYVGKYSYPLDIRLVKLVREQTILFVKQGISKINTEDIYDVSKRSDVHIHVKLRLE